MIVATAPHRRGRVTSVVGLLAGISAAVPGLAPLLGPVRPWHLFALAAFGIAVVAQSGDFGRPGLRIRRLDWFLLLYSLVLLLSEIGNSRALKFAPNVGVIVAPAFLVLLMWAARLVVDNDVSLDRFLSAFVIPAVPCALLAAGQVLRPDAFEFVRQLAPSVSLDERVNSGELIRATGLIGHWTGLGYYLVVVVAGCSCVILLRQRRGRSSIGVWVGLTIALCGVFATFTFGPILLCLALIGLLLVKLGLSFSRLLLFAVGIVSGLVLFGDSLSDRVLMQAASSTRSSWLPSWVPNTVAFRVTIWSEETIPAIVSRPAGWGGGLYGAYEAGRLYPASLRWGSAESQWLLTTVSYGVVSSICLLLVFLAAFTAVPARNPFLGSGVCDIYRLLVGGALVLSVISPVLTNYGFPGAFWCLCGALMGASERFKVAEGGAPQ